MAKYCPRCYTPVQGEQDFCGNCGYKLSNLDYTEKLNDVINNKPKRYYLIILPVLLLLIFLTSLIIAYQKGYIFDRKLPVVKITSPSDTELVISPGVVLSKVIDIDATDNGSIKKVELLENGTVIHSTEDQNTTQYDWKISETGKYVFQAVAYDCCDNVSKSLPLVISVKEEPPKQEVQPTPVYVPVPINQPKASETEVTQITQVINIWVNSSRNRNLSQHLDCYADYLETYFTQHNYTKIDIYPSKEEMMTKYDVIEMSIDQLEITMLDANHAVATFNKKWDAIGAETFSGEEKQRLKFTKINGHWKIISEEELEIYWAMRNGKRID